MDGRPGVIISGKTASGFLRSDGQPARIVIFRRNAALFKDFIRAFNRSWDNACLHEDLLLFHTEIKPTTPYCRGLLNYEMWIEDRLYFNNGSFESIQMAYDRLNGGRFVLRKIPADDLSRPLLWINVLLGAWGFLNTNVYGLQMKKESREILLLLRIPDERIPLGHLFKGFLQSTGDSSGVVVNVDIQTVLDEMVARMAHFHRLGVSNLSLKVDCVNFCPNRRDCRIDFPNLTNVFFKGQPEFIRGWTRDWNNAYSMKVHYLNEMQVKRCLKESPQEESPDSLEGYYDIHVLEPETRKYLTQESNGRFLNNGRRPSDIVLTMADNRIVIREVDYRSLDSEVPEDEFEVIKAYFPEFRIGWLSDGVMIGFFMSIGKEADLPVMVLTTNQLKKPENEFLTRINHGLRWILAPWNPEGVHWILIAVDIMERKLFYLDPDPSPTKRKSRLESDWKVQDKIKSLLKWEGHMFTDISGCSRQASEGDNNCGVFVCFYAKQLVLGKSLEEEVDSQMMRSYIRKKLLEHADYIQTPEVLGTVMCITRSSD